MRFLVKYCRTLTVFGFVMLMAVVALTLTACGVPVWLSDAGNIITLVGASFASVASFIAGLTGNAALAALLAVVSKWIASVQTGISDLQTLISQYQASPNPGLLGDIESALADLQTNVAQDFSNLGLPAAVLNVIAGIAGLANNLLLGWSNAIAGVKAAKTSAEFKTAMSKFTVLADNLPQSIAQFTTDVNAILTTPTGDAMVDAALAKTPKI
jgi:hypothetical protein